MVETLSATLFLLFFFFGMCEIFHDFKKLKLIYLLENNFLKNHLIFIVQTTNSTYEGHGFPPLLESVIFKKGIPGQSSALLLPAQAHQ